MSETLEVLTAKPIVRHSDADMRMFNTRKAAERAQALRDYAELEERLDAPTRSAHEAIDGVLDLFDGKYRPQPGESVAEKANRICRLLIRDEEHLIRKATRLGYILESSSHEFDRGIAEDGGFHGR